MLDERDAVESAPSPSAESLSSKPSYNRHLIRGDALPTKGFLGGAEGGPTSGASVQWWAGRTGTVVVTAGAVPAVRVAAEGIAAGGAVGDSRLSTADSFSSAALAAGSSAALLGDCSPAASVSAASARRFSSASFDDVAPALDMMERVQS